MGEEQEKRQSSVNLKQKITIIITAFLLAIFPLLEGLAGVGVLNYSPTQKLLEYFNANAQDVASEFVEFLSVGQADSTIIKSGDKVAVVDFGLKDEGNNLYWRLKELGIKFIDLAVITHHHSDHLGGLKNLLEVMQVKNLLVSSYTAEDGDKEILGEVIELANKNNVKILSPKIGSSFKFGNATLEVLYFNSTAQKENNRSIITRVEIKNKKILLLGDAESVCENEFMESVSNFSCDILKLGHHGSYTSTSYELLSCSGAKVAVASSGYDNLYGHPSNQVLERLEKENITCYRTDLEGNIRCTFYENSFGVSTERENLN